jgi:metal iron transporter
LTRLIAIIPALAVAVAVGKPGINALLVVSQVILAIVLPFIIIPLMIITSQKKYMTVRGAPSSYPHSQSHSGTMMYPAADDTNTPPTSHDATPPDVQDIHALESGELAVDYSNGKITIVVGTSIGLLVLISNVYVIVTLIRG